MTPTPQLLDTVNTVKALNAMYEKGIQHAIEIVREEQREHDSELRSSPVNVALTIILLKLYHLQETNQ